MNTILFTVQFGIFKFLVHLTEFTHFKLCTTTTTTIVLLLILVIIIIIILLYFPYNNVYQ